MFIYESKYGVCKTYIHIFCWRKLWQIFLSALCTQNGYLQVSNLCPYFEAAALSCLINPANKKQSVLEQMLSQIFFLYLICEYLQLINAAE